VAQGKSGARSQQLKSNQVKWMVVALAVVLVAGVGVSQTVKRVSQARMGAGFPFGGHMLGFFSSYLDLTDAQQAQVKEIMAKERPNIQPLAAQLLQSHQQLRQLAESGAFDEAKVRAIATQQSQTMIELEVQRTRIASELFLVLTPDQKAKMDKFMSRHEQRMMNHLQQGASPE
jgi:Spy/CpxP family protein refolding chaperone